MLKYLRANTFEKKQIDMEFIETYRKTILFFNKNNLLKKYKNTLAFFLYKQIIWRLERLSNEDRKTFFSECMNILKPLEIFDTKYLCYSDNHKIYKINHFRSLNNYIKTITFLNFPILKIEHKYSNNSLIKPILKEKNKLLFNLIPIHKKQITTHKTKKYFLGIKYYSKRKNYL